MLKKKMLWEYIDRREQELYLKPVFSRDDIWKEKFTTAICQTNCLSLFGVFTSQSQKGNRNGWATFLLAGYSSKYID